MTKILLPDRINENCVLETKSRGFFSFFFFHFPLSFVIAFKDDELAAFRNATFAIFRCNFSKLLVDRTRLWKTCRDILLDKIFDQVWRLFPSKKETSV